MAVIEFDLADVDHRALSRFAGRAANLLALPGVKRNPHLVGTIDDFLGAVYALALAKHYGFKDRTSRSIEIDAVSRRARQLAKGEARSDGPWMAGFYFNSAILRLAAVYHRALKVVTGDPSSWSNVPTLRTQATKLFRGWATREWPRQHLDQIHAQVNELKHTPKGSFYGRTVKYSHAIESARELLTLIEAWVQHE